MRTHPKSVQLYLGREVSLDGKSLLRVLQDLDFRAQYWRYDDAFVHAKLIGLESAEGHVLLYGSPNLSRAALLSRGTEPQGDFETASLIQDIQLEELTGTFRPPGLQVSQLDEASIEAIKFHMDDPVASWPIHLWSATMRRDRRIEITCDGELSNEMRLMYASGRLGLNGNVTQEAITNDRLPVIVWLADGTETKISNCVALADEVALQEVLRQRVAHDYRPAGLTQADLSAPLGQLLEWLNSQCIFDVADTNASHATSVRAESGDEDPEFYENFRRDQLKLEPRSLQYRQRLMSGFDNTDSILALLKAMLSRVPSSHVLRAVGTDQPDAGMETASRPRGPNVQLRAFNVLMRWCNAIDNPQLTLLDDAAPIQNFAYLTCALAEFSDEC